MLSSGIQCRTTGYTPRAKESSHHFMRVRRLARRLYRQRCSSLCRNVHDSAFPTTSIRSMAVQTTPLTAYAISIAPRDLLWESLHTYVSRKVVGMRVLQKRKRRILCAIRTLKRFSQHMLRSQCHKLRHLDCIRRLNRVRLPREVQTPQRTTRPPCIQRCQIQPLRPAQRCQQQLNSLSRRLCHLLLQQRQADPLHLRCPPRVSHQPKQQEFLSRQ